MTVIVAARTTDPPKSKKEKPVEAITIASDSQITDGWEKISSAYPKIWEEEGRLLFGAAGLVGAWQAVKYGVTWPHYPEAQDWEEWLVKEIKPLVLGAIQYAELLHKRKGMIDTNMSLVIATGTNLASIDGVGGVVIPRSGRVAIGSGYAQALGSLGDGPWQSEDVVRAAYAASQSDLGCGQPIYWATTLDYEIKEADVSKLS